MLTMPAFEPACINYIKLYYFKLAAGMLVAISFSITVTAQDFENDSLFLLQTKNVRDSLFYNEMKETSHLYNGSEYAYFGHNVKGFPYFESETWQQGAVFYDGNLYNAVSLRYDLVNDALVINDYTQNFPIKLVTDKVRYFTIGNHKFINIFSEQEGKTEFYEELFSGAVSLYARRVKKIVAPARADDNNLRFVQYNTLFLVKNNLWHIINSEKEILRLVPEKKDALKKYIRNNKLNFKKDFEYASLKTLEFYNQP